MSHVSTQLAATKLPVASEKRTRSRSIPNFVLPLQFSEQKRTADRRSRGFIQISFGWPPLSPSFPLTSRVCPLCLHIPSSGPAVLLSFTFNSERNLWVERINSRFAAQESTIVPAVLGLVVAWSRSELVLPDFLQSCPLQIEDAAPIRPSFNHRQLHSTLGLIQSRFVPPESQQTTWRCGRPFHCPTSIGHIAAVEM